MCICAREEQQRLCTGCAVVVKKDESAEYDEHDNCKYDEVIMQPWAEIYVDGDGCGNGCGCAQRDEAEHH
jgi:hypothetical protein